MPKNIQPKAAATMEEEADVDRIIDERTTGKKKEYLCTWMDGAPAQWVEAHYLAGSKAEEDWKAAESDEEEVRDSYPEIARKCKLLKEWLQEAKRPVFYLGAGISAPVLPTFRGKGGLWTKNPQTKKPTSGPIQPTPAHYGITELERRGKVHWCVTQNYDDLSRRAGFPYHKVSELHGNLFVETCDQCQTVYHRDYEVELSTAEDHETGRTCEQKGCQGLLRDNLVHFGEAIPGLPIANAKSIGADLSIVLGSSLKVYPAADLPFRAKRRHRRRQPRPKAVIVNLQKTPMDDEADLVIHATCDEVVQQLL